MNSVCVVGSVCSSVSGCVSSISGVRVCTVGTQVSSVKYLSKEYNMLFHTQVIEQCVVLRTPTYATRTLCYSGSM